MDLEVELTFFNDLNEFPGSLDPDRDLRVIMEDFLLEMRESAKRHGLGWTGTTGYRYEKERIFRGH